MRNKVVTLAVGGREHSVSFDKKLKNTTPEYSVQVLDSLLKTKGVENFRFHVFGKNIIFPDGTKNDNEKTFKLAIANAILQQENN